MSGTAAFQYEIIRSTVFRQPQIARVYFDDGSVREFKFGHHTPERRIVELLPRVILDSQKNYRKKAV